MKYLLDTDHFSILQQRSGREYLALTTRLARHPPTDPALSVVSFHEQVLGCHTYISRARREQDVVSIALSRGLTLLTRNARDFGHVPGLLTEDWTVSSP